MTIKDKLAQSGIKAENASIAQILSAIREQPDKFELKKSEVGAELASLVAYAGKNRAQVAQKLGWKESRISRVLSGKENLTLKSIYELVSALDFEFDVIFRNSKQSRAAQPWLREYLDHEVMCMHTKYVTNVREAEKKIIEAEAVLRTAQTISRRFFQKDKSLLNLLYANKLAANDGHKEYETFSAAA